MMQASLIVETLVALALLGILTGFLIADMQLGRRYLHAAATHEESADAVATAQDVLRRMVEQTYPALTYGISVQEPVFDSHPGRLVRTPGESDERYAERSALTDKVFAIPDVD